MIRQSLSGIGAMLVVLGTAGGFAQVVPATPRKFATRSVGGNGVNAGITVEPGKNPLKVRYTTHFVLADSRSWTSTDGKVLVGKLLAFEDIVVEAPQGGVPPAAAAPPAHPSLVRDGKVRLLINNKACEVKLERLSQADRDFIEQLRSVREKEKATP